jgi:hypothetical protein
MTRGSYALYQGTTFVGPHKGLRENWALQDAEKTILYQGKTLRAAQMLCFVSGHDFSRTVNF